MLAEDLYALHGALQPLDGVTKLHWKHYVNTTSRSKITSVKYFVINENSLVTNYESIHGRIVNEHKLNKILKKVKHIA